VSGIEYPHPEPPPRDPEPDDTLVDSQPVAVFVGGLTAVIDAGVVAANLLGWLDLTGEQTAGVLAFVTAAAGFVGATLREAVWCRRSVRRLTAPSGPATPG
jgi:hypothetical protein